MSTSWTQEAGMTGDPDVDNVQDLAEDASTSAAAAAASETAAATSATAAANSAISAGLSATNASNSADEAADSETAAAASKTAAATSASTASSASTTATARASEASTSQTNAANSATAAFEAKVAAEEAQEAAETAETGAETAQTAAAASQTAAASSASAASTSATAAATSATAAATSATSASGSATTATTKASEAATSATNAATSATNASNAQTAAEAAQTAAETAQTDAETAQTAAEAAQAAAEAAQEAIDGLYLGAQTSDPSVDLNGEAVTAGDWYYNTTTSVTRIYDGSAWQNGAVSTSGFVLAVNNLSDVASASTARTNLGLEIGTDVLAYDATVVYDADIGVNVQAYSSVLAATTASFTTADETKLDGIEAGADVTDTANVTAAGALMDSEVTNLAAVKAFDPTDYATAAQGTTADSALQSSDIGVSVQAYSSVLAGTTASFTTADETKLDGIEASATADQTAQEIATAIDADATAEATLKSALGLGSAAYTASTAYATAAQGTNADTAYGWGNHASAGYLTSFTETDPVYTASSWYTTTNNSTNWNTAYGWGDHSSAGYITGNQTITLSGDVSGSGTTSIAVTIADDSHNHVISNVDGLQTALDAKASTGKAIAMAIVFG